MKTTTLVRTLFRTLSLAMLAGAFCAGAVFAARPTATNNPTNTPTSVPPNAATASAANGNTPSASATAQDGSSTDVVHPVPGQRNPRYRICRDDVLNLTFPIAPEFDQEQVTVMPDGYVSLQGVGSVYVLGLTVPETVDALKKAYSAIMRDPIIDLDLRDFQKPFFVALGQVGKPGQYDLRYDMTVMQAIAVAGGFAPTAKTQVFLFHQISPTTVEVKKLNIKDVMNGKGANEQVHMSPGDTIVVPEKTITNFRKYVPYSVGAGYYPSALL